MKHWATLAFIIAGLSFVLYFQLLQRQPIERASDSTVYEDPRPLPPEPAAPPKPDRPVLTFGGYPCAGDCSEDKAGYEWGEQNRITDPDSCIGNTGAFIEGCRVYAQRQAARNADY